MFRLNDAVRRYQAERRPTVKLRCVATAASTMSPYARPDHLGYVAGIATVAAQAFESADPGKLIERLKNEGAILLQLDNTLHFRPTHWGQLQSISQHWKSLLRFLQTTDEGDDHGPSRSA
ncbi:MULTISPECIES: hypothetical protein [unclassified Pseudomonas]|uniref:hypothetical protein n=1 Tax=unclassified Pseudomonas TaxID=196821 RepID=UPI000BD31A07|nr:MULTISPECIES: hypothetical protein [unclassified Pseudomonas]PVZ12614.1 hypothetical protein F474_03419 [Pseudomonas sp. URIL14HWK12:I12]PVZ23234.1 hypothetical protein F470_02783 [Pseudomonas sp. URIL14HWK12:I10]PVZ32564.1 hypothetical protein F472_03131 [Pseudomonas sp. URIL14HWK12:I11]SNZ13676.1 hypothetical protein SAMN05660463_02480 [Pseudomonas sp. URIL14HWK12:I9]